MESSVFYADRILELLKMAEPIARCAIDPEDDTPLAEVGQELHRLAARIDQRVCELEVAAELEELRG